VTDTAYSQSAERQPQALPLIYFPDTRLYETSSLVSNLGSEELKHFAADLVFTMNANNGVGLAGVQVGRAERIFAMKDGSDDLVLVNPVWYPAKDAVEVKLLEGCLSFPEVFEHVLRLDKVEVEFEDVAGVQQKRSFEGIGAHIVQHETEHLDGHLFIESLPIHLRDRIRLKMKQRTRLSNRIQRALKSGEGIDSLVKAGILNVQKFNR
jgi:peptide deformylase